jgi:hypothetical protein
MSQWIGNQAKGTYLQLYLLHLPIEFLPARRPDLARLDYLLRPCFELDCLFRQVSLEEIDSRVEECLHSIYGLGMTPALSRSNGT